MHLVRLPFPTERIETMLSSSVTHLAKVVIPSKYRARAATLKERALGYGYRTYSQQGEDVILRILFHGVKDGFYVDVGAHHPKQYSNTYYFYKKGWRGINIDAMPGSMQKFRKARPRDINLEVGVSKTGGSRKYYAFNEPGLSGFSRQNSEKRSSESGRYIDFTKQIETFPLNEILDRHLPEQQTIDFLSVDVEGLDVEVLESNDWNKYTPSVVLAEALDLSKLEEIYRSPVYRLLKEKGYFLFSKCVHTLIFVREGFSPLGS